MREPDKEAGYQQALELLYDAVTDPKQWFAALDLTQNLFNATSSRFFTWDIRADRMVDFVNSSTYTGHSARWDLQVTDPRRRILERSAPGFVLACHEHFDDAFVRSCPFYTDYSLPFGRRYLLAANTLSEGEAISILALFRAPRQGRFESQELMLFQRFMPHLRRVARLHQTMHDIQTDGHLDRSMVDNLPVALFVTDGSARICRLNLAAERLISSSVVLSARFGRLHANTHAATQRLHQLVARTVAAAERRITDGSGSLMLECIEGGRRVVTVTPLSGQSTTLGKPEYPLALISVSDLQALKVNGRKLTELFGLTPAEARLANEVAAGRRLDQIASEHKVKMPTLRTQIASIFSKTATERQADLVQLMTKLAAMEGEEPRPTK